MTIPDYKKKRWLKIFIIIFITTSIILSIRQCCKSMPDLKVLSTKTYDIYELTITDNSNYIYYSYIDENNKINKDYNSDDNILKVLYLGDKNQITVENLGYDKEITKVRLIKFYVDEQTYKELSKIYEWDTEYNMDYY